MGKWVRVGIGVAIGGVAVGLLAVAGFVWSAGAVAAGAQRDAALLTAARIAERVERHHLDAGAYPETLAEVSADLDPFGHPYGYRRTDQGFELRSFGADGVEGGTGAGEDIVYTVP